MAVAVEERAATQWRERQGKPPRLRLAGEEFLEQHRPARHLGGAAVLDDRRDLVAEREQAARLEADDRHAARSIGCERRERALGLFTCLVDAAHGEESAAAAQRPRAAVGGGRDLDAVAAGAQHRERGAQVFRLEVAVEGVGEEDDVAVGSVGIVACAAAAVPSSDAAAPSPTLPRKRERGLVAARASASRNQSPRQRGSVRRAENSARLSDSAAAPGMRSRKLNSQGKRAAIGA